MAYIVADGQTEIHWKTSGANSTAESIDSAHVIDTYKTITVSGWTGSAGGTNKFTAP